MKLNHVLLILCYCCLILKGYASRAEKGQIIGKIEIDSTWSSKIYLSYIPTFEDVYTMSPEMIIAETKIDEQGRFSFDLNYLPQEEKLYRLHISKKGDSRSSLIIGGKNENFILLIANKDSIINFETTSFYPPFKNVLFIEDQVNSNLQYITNLMYLRDSLASVSDLYKRKFVNSKFKQDLLSIADSTTNALISMYAVYQSGFESDYNNNTSFYEELAEKWSEKDNAYVKNFKTRFPYVKPKRSILIDIAVALAFLCIGIVLGKYLPFKKHRIKNLSVQERKILEKLREGASNKEISEKFNIGLSTVKSHVSSILSKMNVKSRKELMR